MRIWPAAMLVVAGCAIGHDQQQHSATTGGVESGSVGSGSGVEANAVVERIVDGDTIDVRLAGHEERVRLIGIDTPETAHEGRPAECYGDEATLLTESLVPVGTRVRLERDIVGRDDYGRLLAYVYRADDALFVNDEIVRTGHARPLTIEPNSTHATGFVDAARHAERSDLGLWAACAGR